ncbi:restriction endonuclease subunit S [Shewanella sp. 202IG2-18]|uniref:restriction endonuclease subunit S n=1 Tax=Parashewanella hymeniacidonis TaxID=2807618 RepID=UPI00195F8C92|nr:restriction endonuclease subunit S [Parashewanella hymeniacidonis]MBM7073687.1 restriction endonuclease subunit S [Parashewanella hymeniacidonis]
MTGRYKAYPEYKNTDEVWLGDVPSHWRDLKINRLTIVKRGASPRPIDDPQYFDETGEYAWVRIADVTASDTYLKNTTQRLSPLGASLSVKLEPNELFLSIAGTVGKPCINKIKACIHDGFVYFPEFKENTKFLFYIFAAGEAYKGLGKFGTQLNLNTETVGGIKIGIPCIEEQQKIANFLDHETAKIDTLIAKQEKLIGLLKEKRQAVISHAVTKGLNPQAPMIDSGVEWLGKVPEHWDITSLRRFINKMEQGKSPECDSSPAPIEHWGVLKTSCVNNAKFDPTANKMLPPNIEPHSKYEVKGGDILMSRASGSINLIGSVAKVQNDVRTKILLSDKVFRLYLTSLMNTDFFVHLMASNYVRTLVENAISGAEGMANNITKSAIMDFTIPVPPVEEQKLVVAELEKQVNRFDILVAKAESVNTLIKERKTALISAAVTGKIDVRDWQGAH